MSQRVIAGPTLLELGADLTSWANTVRQWEVFLRQHQLAASISRTAVGESNAHGHWPIWPRVQSRVRHGRLEIETSDIIRLYSSLTSRFTEIDEDCLIFAPSASGCLGAFPCDQIAGEVRAAALLAGGSTPLIAASAAREDETVQGTRVRFLRGEDEETAESVVVTCVPSPQDLLEFAEISEWLDRPEFVVSALVERMKRDGSPAPESEIVFHPGFMDSLRAMPRAKWEGTLRTLALLSLPISARPAGIRERPIRRSVGANAQQLQSRCGAAFRATLSVHGPGWRLHYWRAGRVLTAAAVASHDTLDIPC
jgi:hypothetical protein